MKITEVKTKADSKEFIDFPKRLYKDDTNWICPLDSGIESIFDPAKNHTFRNGKAVRWLLKDDGGNTIGRIAAFIDKVRSAANNQATGGMGFFEVIEDRKAAFRLFDTARTGLQGTGWKQWTVLLILVKMTITGDCLLMASCSRVRNAIQ
jgi:hypothetical protein